MEDNIKTFLNLLVFLIAIAYTLVPIIFIYQLKAGVLDPERVSILGILFLYINAFLYFSLSVRFNEGDNKIDIRDFCNLSGAYLGLIYLILYLKYQYYENDKNLFFFFSFILIVVSVIGLLIIFYTDIKALFEWIGVLFNILEYLPLGFNLGFLIKNKISEKYTLFGATVGLINTIVWLIWAIYSTIKNTENKKVHSIIANSAGLILCITQIAIYCKFKEDTRVSVGLNSTADLSGSRLNDTKDDTKGEQTEIIEDFI